MPDGEWQGVIWAVASAQLPAILREPPTRPWLGRLTSLGARARQLRHSQFLGPNGLAAESAIRAAFSGAGFCVSPLSETIASDAPAPAAPDPGEYVPLGALHDRAPFDEHDPAFFRPSALRFAQVARNPDRTPRFYEPFHEDRGQKLAQHLDLVVSRAADGGRNGSAAVVGEPDRASLDKEADLVRLELAQLLAARRWFAYAPGIARRLYIVSLPPALAHSQPTPAGCEDAPPVRFVVCCFLTLLRVPSGSAFRKTLTLTAFLVPVSSATGSLEHRRLDSAEFGSILQRRYPGFRYRKGREMLRLTGPLVDGLRERPGNEYHPLRWWSEHVLADAVDVLCPGDGLSAPESATQLWTSSLMSWGSGAALLRPAREEKNHSEESILDALGTEWEALDDLRIPSRQRNQYTLLYIPAHRTLIGLLGERAEQFPATSALGLAASLAFMSASLSALHAMTNAFHHAVEATNRTGPLLRTSGEFVRDFEELYDLDLLVPDYKEAFERVKELDGADRDYKYLRGYLEGLTSTVTAQSTQRSSSLTIVLSGLIVLLTVFLIQSPLWVRWVVTCLTVLLVLGGLAWVSVSATWSARTALGSRRRKP